MYSVYTHTQSTRVKSTLSELTEFQMCGIVIQAIKALVVYISNSASAAPS